MLIDFKLKSTKIIIEQREIINFQYKSIYLMVLVSWKWSTKAWYLPLILILQTGVSVIHETINKEVKLQR